MLFFRALAPAVLLSISLVACSGEADTQPSTEPTTAVASSADATVARRIAVVRRRIEANNSQDWNTWESLHTDNAVRTAPGIPEPLRGAKAMRAGIEELFVTFPDYTLTLVDAFGSDDRLMARIHTRATMLGPIDIGAGPIPPTGRVFEQDWIAVLRFEGDRIASIDEFYDNYTVLIQLGLAGGD